MKDESTAARARETVAQAMAAGKRRIDLTYATRREYEDAFYALRGAGWRVTAQAHGAGGTIVVSKPQDGGDAP